MCFISKLMLQLKIISSLIFIMQTLILQVHNTFNLVGSYSTGFLYYSMNFQSSNMGAASANGYIYMWDWPPGTTIYHQCTYLNPINRTDVKVRTHQVNHNLPNGTIIVFNSTSIYLQQLFYGSWSWQQIYSTPVTITIINSCFGVNTTEIFILILNSSIPGYQLLHNMSGVVSKTDLATPVSSENNKMVYKNNTLYVSFQTGIEILSGNSSLLPLKTINFPPTLAQYIDVSADTLAFGYSYNQTIYILSTVDFRTLWQTTLNQMISGIKIVGCFLIVYADPYIYQIDLELGQIVYSYYYIYPGLYFVDYIIDSKSIFLYNRDNPVNNTFWRIFNFTTDYITNTSTCITSYTYFSSNSSCVKIISHNVIINHINLNATTRNINQSSANKFVEMFSQLDFDKYSTILGKALIISSIKITPNCLLVFTVFLDDLYLYRFHRKVYPVPAQWFMKEVNLINEFRLSLWFIDFINAIDTKYVFPEENKQRYNYLNFTGSDPEDVYFLYSSEDVYQGNLLLNLIIISSLKVLSLIANYAQKKFEGRKLICSIANDLRNNVKLWVLLIAVFENNMIKLSFNAFLELLSCGHLQKQDKLNVVITYCFLFVLIFYSLCFYPLIYEWESRRCSSILLIKYKCRLGGFFIESLNLVCRNLMKGFVHSFFIANYPLQISLLSGLDLAFALISIKTYKYFKYKFIGLLCVLYYIAFFLFDLYFCVKEIVPETLIQSWDPEQVSFILLVVLAGTAIIISISYLLGNIIDFFLFIFNQYINYQIKQQQKQDEIKCQENKLKQSKSQNKNQVKSLKKKVILIKNSNPHKTCFGKNTKKVKKERKCKEFLKIQNYQEKGEKKYPEQITKIDQVDLLKATKEKKRS